MKLSWTQQHRLPILAAAALLTLLGMLALLRLPLQLLPDIEEPTISIFTAWPGASALEVERVISEPHERVLRGLPGLVKVTANASNGESWLQTRFEPGSDRTLLLWKLSVGCSACRACRVTCVPAGTAWCGAVRATR